MTDLSETVKRAQDAEQAAYLHRVAADTRKTAADLDQIAGRIERRLGPIVNIPCCAPGACMICGADSPPGHVHVLLPGSREDWQLPIGRICSSHTLLDIAKTDRLLAYIEGEAEPRR